MDFGKVLVAERGHNRHGTGESLDTFFQLLLDVVFRKNFSNTSDNLLIFFALLGDFNRVDLLELGLGPLSRHFLPLLE